MSDELITIETPEHIQVHYELAGIGSRALAGALDLLLQGLITGIIVGGLIFLGARLGWTDAYGVAASIAIATAGFLAATAYYVISEMTMDGQSFGKRIAGLRVIRDDGTPITFLDSAIRNIIRVVDMFPFFYSIGLIAVFLSKRSKRLGDMAAGTVVVKERMLEQPQGAAEFPAEAALATLPPDVEARLRNALHLLSPADFETAERFIERRYELDASTRQRLGGQFAAVMLAKLNLSAPDDFTQPELILETLVRLRRLKPL